MRAELKSWNTSLQIFHLYKVSSRSAPQEGAGASILHTHTHRLTHTHARTHAHTHTHTHTHTSAQFRSNSSLLRPPSLVTIILPLFSWSTSPFQNPSPSFFFSDSYYSCLSGVIDSGSTPRYLCVLVHAVSRLVRISLAARESAANWRKQFSSMSPWHPSVCLSFKSERAEQCGWPSGEGIGL